MTTEIFAEIGEVPNLGERIILSGTLWNDKFLIEQIPGKRWDRKAALWSLPLSWASCVVARAQFGDRLKVGAELGTWARFQRDANERSLFLRELTALDGPSYYAEDSNDHDAKLFPFQVPGRDFLVTARNALLGDEMGCIEGDARIKVQRNGATRTMTMRQLHHRFHRTSGPGKLWDHSKPARVKSMAEDGTLTLNDIIDVMHRGEQQTIRINLESGRSVRVTRDHRMSTGLGAWAEAGSLSAGDTLMVNGVANCVDCGELKEVSTYPYAKFYGMCKPCMLKRRKPRVGPLGPGRFSDKNGYVMLTSFPDHPNADANGNIREHVKVMSDHLGRPLAPGEIVHHRDENKRNNSIENLELTTQSEHAKHHGVSGGFKHMHGGRGGKGGEIWFRAHEDRIVSIEEGGVVDVYDIEMKAPNHNFVVEGIVVHNSGKTFQTIAALRTADSIEPAYPALIVCPNTLKRNWEREIRQWLPEANPFVIHGDVNKRRKQLAEAAELPNAVVIMNIESVRLHSRLSPYGSTRLKKCTECDPQKGTPDLKVSACEAHPKELNAIPFKVCVLDEAHRVKNPQALQSRAIWNVFHGDTVEFRWALTGTPVANHPGDLWSIMHTIDPLNYPAKSAFIDRYALKQYNPFGGMDIVGLEPRHKDEFYALLDPHFRRMIKAEVLSQLPAKVFERRDVEMSPKQAKAYKDVENSYVTQLEDGTVLVADGSLPAATRLLQFASAMCKVDTEDAGYDAEDPATWRVQLTDPSPKVDELLAIIEDNPGKPLVVAAEHRQLIDLAAQRLVDKGIEFARVTGGVSADERDAAVQAFQDGKIDYILFTYKAGGVGLNLTRADTMVRLQRSWSLIDNNQGVDRIHRIGSEVHESVTIIDLVTARTIEETQIQRLYEKAERLEEIVRDRAKLAALGQSTEDLDAEQAKLEATGLMGG